MANRQELLDVFIGFDRNLPKIHRCRHGCEEDSSVFCIHKLNFRSEIINYNESKYRYRVGDKLKGWPDARILLHFLRSIQDRMECGLVSDKTIFIIVTKDKDFLKDAQIEWRMHGDRSEDPVIGGNSVQFGNIAILVQTVEGSDNLPEIIKKMNEFIKV